MDPRRARVERETRETRVMVELALDGRGEHQIDTGNGTLDHLLAQLARHGLMDLTVQAQGDLETGWHHLVEDVGIALGRALREALPQFNQSIPGYAMDDALLTGVETRTSSPVRIPRTKALESVNTPGLYPAGEGAGFAGGILSAAMDGIRVAEAVGLTLLRQERPGAPDESAYDRA